MPDENNWLTAESAVADAERVLTGVNEIAAQFALRPGIARDWFFSSVGVVDITDDRSKETYYLSKLRGAWQLYEFNVVPWTNWLGDVCVRAREAVEREHGCLPDQMDYGPDENVKSRPLGPFVEYSFRDGAMTDLAFYIGSRKLPLLRELEQPIVEEKADFGLKQIIQTIDAEQNEKIRWPMHGMFLLTGGPGVGKTTVALHRIPYLINEQLPYEELIRRRERQLFFSQDNTLVVVWKEHLVPYLRKCLEQLDLQDFPEENVRHVEDWIDARVRNYVPIGPNQNEYTIEDFEDIDIDEAKRGLTDRDVAEFVHSAHRLARESAAAILETAGDVRESLRAVNRPYRYVGPPKDYHFTVKGIEQVIDLMRVALPEPPNARTPDHRSVSSAIGRAREAISQLRSRELNRVSKYVGILQDFYESEVVKSRLAKKSNIRDQFHGVVSKQASDRVLSKADRYILLWIIYYLTEGSTSDSARLESLPSYSHIVIDEAQYYDPLVLRLLTQLARLNDSQRGTMTIVGDLKQIAKGKRRFKDWEDLGLEIPAERRYKLTKNYRWSKQVFSFLNVYKRIARIDEELTAPRKWHSGEGEVPEVRQAQDRHSEIASVAQRILDLRRAVGGDKRTIAVVVPESLTEIFRTRLVSKLKGYTVKSDWLTGLNVRESVDLVVLTDYDSIVGLEFDCVFIVGADVALSEKSGDQNLNVWVAATRPRKFICVSYVGTCELFDQPDFDVYR